MQLLLPLSPTSHRAWQGQVLWRNGLQVSCVSPCLSLSSSLPLSLSLPPFLSELALHLEYPHTSLSDQLSIYPSIHPSIHPTCPVFIHLSFSHNLCTYVAMPSSSWDGAAYSMGHTTKQWRASYNPSHRKRAVQEALVAHSSFTHKMNRTPPSAPSSSLPPLHSSSLSIRNGEGTSRTFQSMGAEDGLFEADEARPLPFQLHPAPREGQARAVFISSAPGRKRKHSSSDIMPWGAEWGSW